MENAATRLLVGLTALVIIWIAVYWAWPSDSGRVTFSAGDDAASEVEGSGGVMPVIITQGSRGSTGGSRAAVEAPVQAEPPIEAGSTADDVEDNQRADPVIAPRFREYTVKSGDNAWRIAEREYGSARHWVAVAKSNPLKNIDNLNPGDVIRLAVDPNNIQGIPESEQTARTPGTIEYRVQRGDTLSEISKRFYGTVRYTDVIYRANRDRMRSKNALRAGQVLLIPGDPNTGNDGASDG